MPSMTSRDVVALFVGRDHDRDWGDLERALRVDELVDGDTIDQLVDLSSAAQRAGVHALRPGEAEASMSAAVT